MDSTNLLLQNILDRIDKIDDRFIRLEDKLDRHMDKDTSGFSKFLENGYKWAIPIILIISAIISSNSPQKQDNTKPYQSSISSTFVQLGKYDTLRKYFP